MKMELIEGTETSAINNVTPEITQKKTHYIIYIALQLFNLQTFLLLKEQVLEILGELT